MHFCLVVRGTNTIFSAGFTAGHTGHVPRASANKEPSQIDFVGLNLDVMHEASRNCVDEIALYNISSNCQQSAADEAE